MAKRFERALEAATEQTLIEPNWEGILECVDMIRGSDVPVKEAIPLIQKRYHSANPHIAHHALLVLEACVKNCGKKLHVEIATREFMDDLKNIIIGGSVDKVKEKVLELIQCWSSAFRDKPEYKIVVDTHNLLKMNGFEFPAMREADAMFIADSAPDWVEGDNCYRCRTEFGMFTRKHHCRACGQIFCDRCSSKQMLLPQFGIEKRVRVCESCYDKRMNQKASSSSDSKHHHHHHQRRHYRSMPSGFCFQNFLFGISPVRERRVRRTAPTSGSSNEDRERARLQELMDREAEELQLALAISQSEAEAKERQNRNVYSSIYSRLDDNKASESEKTDQDVVNNSEVYRGAASSVDESLSTKMENDSAPMDSVLAKYLDRDYWERKRMGKEPDNAALHRATAPPPSEYSVSIASNDQPNVGYLDTTLVMDSTQNGIQAATSSFDKFQINGKQQLAVASNGEQEVLETAGFCKALKEQVDTMDNRMRSNLLRGRSIINDSAIHSLFAQLTNSHADVLGRMTKLEGEREYYETLQDQLAHIQEARQAVNALREEHMRQKEARLLEEQQQRRAQMQHTLEIMRQKKHETLLYQRHLALQRFQEQEQQMQQRRMLYQQHPSMTPHQPPAQPVHHPAYYAAQQQPIGGPANGSPLTVLSSTAQPMTQDKLFYQQQQMQAAAMYHPQHYQPIVEQQPPPQLSAGNLYYPGGNIRTTGGLPTVAATSHHQPYYGHQTPSAVYNHHIPQQHQPMTPVSGGVALQTPTLINQQHQPQPAGGVPTTQQSIPVHVQQPMGGMAPPQDNHHQQQQPLPQPAMMHQPPAQPTQQQYVPEDLLISFD